MRLVVSGSFHSAVRPTVERLVWRGFEGTDHGGVEVHVKASRPQVSYRTTVKGRVGRDEQRARVEEWAKKRGQSNPTITRIEHHRYPGVRGYAYKGVPESANAVATAKWLVTITIPIDSRGRPTGRYPQHNGYYGVLKTAPKIDLYNWREDLVFTVAHEATHIRQFRSGRRASEVEAERMAAIVLDEARDEGLCDTR